MKWLYGLLALAVLAIGIFGIWYYLDGGTTLFGAPTSFKTAPVERGNLTATISATGTLQAEEVVDVGAQVAAQIKFFGRDPRNSSKPIDFGSEVEEGTVLAQLDDMLFKARVNQAKANLLRADADLLQHQAKARQAEREWQRAQDLGPSKGISAVEYDTAKANFESTKALVAVGQSAVAQAKAALEEADINLGYTMIRSPVRGVIVDRRVNVGQTVVASLNAPSLFLIAKDLKRLQVWASVNEADIGSIRAGQPVRFTVDAHPRDEFTGTVLQIRLNATMTANVVTYTVVVETDNSSGKLLPYETANLRFEISERENVLLVPNAALRWRPQINQVTSSARDEFAKSLKKRTTSGKSKGADKGQNWGTVWVPDGSLVRPVQVEVGYSDGEMTEIVTGELHDEDQVVVREVRQSSSEGGVNPFLPKKSMRP